MNGNRFMKISRKQLEESGEILKEKEHVQGQSDDDQEQVSEWDALKDFHFGEEQAQDSLSEEEEMGM